MRKEYRTEIKSAELLALVTELEVNKETLRNELVTRYLTLDTFKTVIPYLSDDNRIILSSLVKELDPQDAYDLVNKSRIKTSPAFISLLHLETEILNHKELTVDLHVHNLPTDFYVDYFPYLMDLELKHSQQTHVTELLTDHLDRFNKEQKEKLFDLIINNNVGKIIMNTKLLDLFETEPEFISAIITKIILPIKKAKAYLHSIPFLRQVRNYGKYFWKENSYAIIIAQDFNVDFLHEFADVLDWEVVSRVTACVERKEILDNFSDRIVLDQVHSYTIMNNHEILSRFRAEVPFKKETLKCIEHLFLYPEETVIDFINDAEYLLEHVKFSMHINKNFDIRGIFSTDTMVTLLNALVFNKPLGDPDCLVHSSYLDIEVLEKLKPKDALELVSRSAIKKVYSAAKLGKVFNVKYDVKDLMLRKRRQRTTDSRYDMSNPIRKSKSTRKTRPSSMVISKTEVSSTTIAAARILNDEQFIDLLDTCIELKGGNKSERV